MDAARPQPSANPSQIQDEDEVRRWFAEGRTYSWMSEEYESRYNITTTPTLWGNVRRRWGLPRRVASDDVLIPWPIASHHRWHFYLVILRMESRRRAGAHLAGVDETRLEVLKHQLAKHDLVVAYDPESAEGFGAAPRRPGIDLDMIREPYDG